MSKFERNETSVIDPYFQHDRTFKNIRSLNKYPSDI